MRNIGDYQTFHSYKISEPFRSKKSDHEGKTWTLQQQIYTRLEKVAVFLDNLNSKTTEKYGHNVQLTIKRNLAILQKDLDLMETILENDPDSFTTSKLKTNQECIAEMKAAFDTLQAFEPNETKHRALGKIKHCLTELEQVIHPKLTRLQMAVHFGKVKTKKPRKTSNSKKVSAVKKSTVKTKAKKAKVKKKKG